MLIHVHLDIKHAYASTYIHVHPAKTWHFMTSSFNSVLDRAYKKQVKITKTSSIKIQVG